MLRTEIALILSNQGVLTAPVVIKRVIISKRNAINICALNVSLTDEMSIYTIGLVTKYCEWKCGNKRNWQLKLFNCKLGEYKETKRVAEQHYFTYTLDSKKIKDNMGRISVWLIFFF